MSAVVCPDTPCRTRRKRGYSLVVLLCLRTVGGVAAPPARYYAYPAVHDRFGVIAPWYKARTGSATSASGSPPRRSNATRGPMRTRRLRPAPEYIYSGAWKIAPDGTITDPADQRLGQRRPRPAGGVRARQLIDYYRYTGDAAAIAHMTLRPTPCSTTA